MTIFTEAAEHTTTTEIEGTPLLVFADDWGRHPSSCQHLVGRLMDRHAVTWVNTIGMRPPRLDRATFRRVLEKLGGWTTRESSSAQAQAGPRVIEARMWPWFRSSRDRALNRALLLRQLGPHLARMSRAPVVVTTVPVVADLVGVLPVKRWVYYRVDDFGSWPGLDGLALGRLDERLVRDADLIIAAGAELVEQVARQGRKARLLTHGVDLRHWESGHEAPSPSWPELDAREPPRVVFWGLVDRRMDVAIVRALDAALPEGTIVLAGPGQDPDPELNRLRRVARLPALPYASLPALAGRASVLIMPYADTAVTRAMQPLKLTEYLATGKPVVSRGLPATRAWSDALDLADSPEAFAAAVRLRIETGVPESQRLARLRLAAEDWSDKSRRFERWLFEPEGSESET